MLTLERLKEALYYDPGTGIFWWLISHGRAKSGAVAGSISSQGYVVIKVDSYGYKAHRLAWFYMTGAWSLEQTDHINRDRADDRWDNLREATGSQNGANNTRRIGKHGFKGVSASARGKPWMAKIRVHGNLRHLGCFDTKEEAYAAYCRAAQEHFGEFARL